MFMVSSVMIITVITVMEMFGSTDTVSMFIVKTMLSCCSLRDKNIH